MTIVDEAKILTGEDIKITKFLSIKQPTVKEVILFGESRYFSMIHSLTSEPFDMPYYLDEMGIDFETITPFELFCILIPGIPYEDTQIIFGDLNFSKFKIVQRDAEIILIDNRGEIIDAGVREIIAATLRRMHCLPKNELTSCYNSFAHKLLIKKQKRDIEQAQKRREMFGEKSEIAALVSSLACEWHSYQAVLELTISQFFDATVRGSYKEGAESLLAALRTGSLSPGSYSKKDLNWRRPITINPL